MSEITYSTSTRFGDANEFNKIVEELKKEGIVLGVNLSFNEINEFTKQFKE